ncbi:MAG: hypothetical protein NVS3B20_11120 [Polyangiales bacterium]
MPFTSLSTFGRALSFASVTLVTVCLLPACASSDSGVAGGVLPADASGSDGTGSDVTLSDETGDETTASETVTEVAADSPTLASPSTCATPCKSNAECVATCPAVSGGGQNCCDTATGLCYPSMSACPVPVLDAGPTDAITSY